MFMYYLNHNNQKRDDEGIAAILPVYIKEVGDTTELIEYDGKRRTLYTTINSVINKLIGLFSLNITTLREKYNDIIYQKKTPPLPLSENLILIPFKVRRPEVKGDPTYGYINYKCIENYERAGKHSKLLLTNGIEIPLKQSLATTQKNIIHARLIANEMELKKHRDTAELVEEILTKKSDPSKEDNETTEF